MILLKEKKFNHEAPSVEDAMHIPDCIRLRSREKIIFATMSNAILGEQIFGYGNDEDKPAELKTITGDLQRTLLLIDNELEYEYTLFTFQKVRAMARGISEHYLAIHSDHTDQELKKKAMMSLKMLKLKNVIDDMDVEDNADLSQKTYDVKSLFNRMNIIKKCKFDFDKYFEYINNMEEISDEF
jgi:hypothetical protein